MENQHRKIKEYRELSQEEIDLMNSIKKKGEELDLLVGKIDEWNRVEAENGNIDLILESESQKWTETAKTTLQLGIMTLIRSVAKPESF